MSIVHAQIETITVDARAKINLALHVTARRPDGYHLLDSLVVFADIADRISVRPKAGFSLSLSGPYSSSLADTPLDDNLVLRAGRAMGVALGRDDGAAITLEKNLPIASGIGGGSADAAATLVALQKLWGATPGPDALQAMALGLGADVPVCLAGRPRRMRGVGEILDPVPALPDLWIVLANPGISVSTPAVFRARAPSFSAPVRFPDRFSSAASLADWLRHATRNDLEAAALAICPQIGDVLSALAQAPGCLLARMSGSGATCFALHASSETAATAAAGLDARGWWARAGKLGT